MPTRIIVFVEGGVITCISCSDPTTSVSVVDYDDLSTGEGMSKEEADKLVEESKTLNDVY